MEQYNIYAINKDNCPDSDAIISKDTCTGCEHYRGFELYLGQPCVKCSSYIDVQDEDE